jgi:hypothetical protein
MAAYGQLSGNSILEGCLLSKFGKESSVQWSVARFIERITSLTMLAIALVACTQSLLAQSANEFRRTIAVSIGDPVVLDVELPEGDLQIVYSRDGQVSITATSQGSAGNKADDAFPATALAITQSGNRVEIRHPPGTASPEPHARMLYRIDVPYRTEVHSVLDNGKQTITGIMGPVEAVTDRGDIKASYISKGLLARAAFGNLDIEVIGERVEARTGSGNISCVRVAQGVSAETEDGDIVLMVVGTSTATVKKGAGRIEVGGARGNFTGSTDGGDLHVKASPHEDWDLKSATGSVRIELPPAARFEADATTNSGEIQISRDDMERPDKAARFFHQKVNGGGKQINAHTDSGKIVIR